jgi:sterol desaturase/sphingolipid hydroxylase (fatty acid hydroxylase superfamily)
MRLFRLTKREYYADFFITPPVTAVLAVLSLRQGISLAWACLLICGVIAWTLYEYVLHRWLSHCCWPLTVVHGWHHDRQKDYIALHPAATLFLYATLWLTLGVQSSAFMVGFSTGYILYSVTHTMFHYADISDAHVLFSLKRHHALHHALHDVNFGVSTTLWDSVFGTRRA